MPLVWQKFHQLTGAQVLVVSVFCAVIIATSIAIGTVPAEGTSMQHFLRPSSELNPLINFGFAFGAVIPLVLGYYHLGRLGILLGLVISGVLYLVTHVLAFVIFGFGLFGGSVRGEAVAYIGICLSLVALILREHIKASSSRIVRDAQRYLNLSTTREQSSGTQNQKIR